MNKIINGRRYDTATARAVAEARSPEGRSDFHYWEETLYRKQTGEYFLYGSGNAASKYARSVGLNEWGSGERIMPLTIEKARQWAEEHLDADEYEEIFGSVEEDTKKTVSLSLTASAIEKIARLAAEGGISKSEVIERLLLK